MPWPVFLDGIAAALRFIGCVALFASLMLAIIGAFG